MTKSPPAKPAELLFEIVVVGAIIFILCGVIAVTVAIAQRFDSMESVASDIETWSVTNPSHPLSYQKTFSLEEFSEASGNQYNISGEYDVVRPGNVSSGILCFTDRASRPHTITVYSFDSGELSGSKNSCEDN